MILHQHINKYWTIALISAKEHSRYRANYLTEVCGMLLWTGFTMLTWWSIYDINGVTMINGYDRPTMMLYLFGVGVIVSSIHLLQQGDKAVDDINKGTLNNYLTKPIYPLMYWFIYDLSRKVITTVTIVSFSALVLLALSPWISLGIQWTHALTAVLFIVIGAVLNFFLFHCISLLSFWVGVSWGYSFVLRVTMIIATGGLIPLELLSPTVQRVLTHAPFQFFGYVPIQALLGNLNSTEIAAAAVQGAGWIVVCITIGYMLYKKGLRAYEAYGG